MKTPSGINRLLLPVILATMGFTNYSCDQPTRSNSSQTNDTASVKKMSTDSNSDMPIHLPKDSSEKIPNPYDTLKKQN